MVEDGNFNPVNRRVPGQQPLMNQQPQIIILDPNNDLIFDMAKVQLNKGVAKVVVIGGKGRKDFVNVFFLSFHREKLDPNLIPCETCRNELANKIQYWAQSSEMDQKGFQGMSFICVFVCLISYLS